MKENGKPLSLSSFIDAYKTNDVFTGKYYGKVLEGSDKSVQKDFKQVKKDIESNSMLNQLLDMEKTVKQMGLAVYVYPQTNATDKTITGYKMVIYDPKNQDKVIGDNGKYKDNQRKYSYSKFIDVGFADSVKLGHSGINNYTDVLDSDNNRIVRLKQNEAQIKIFNDKLHIMQGKFKNKGGNALRYVKSASRFADQEMKSVEQKTKANLQDKDDDTYRSGSQMLDAQLAEKVNISPLLTQMKYAYGINEKYNKKVMETLSLVSHAKDQAAALKIIETREKDLRHGIKKYDGFKQALLSIQKSGIEYDYGNTSETAYSTYKSATFNRNLIAGDVLLSPVLREQGRKNTHNLSNDEKKREKQIKELGIVRGILASKTGEAKEVTYAGDIVNKRNELAYDAAVKAIEMSDKELAEQGKKNLSVREGQSIVSGKYAELLDTSHHTMSKTFSKKDLEEAKEEFDKLSKKKKDKTINNEELKRLNKLNPYFNKDGSMRAKELAAHMFTEFLKHSKMSLFKPDSGTSDLANVDIFENDNGGYTVSGEGQVKFESGRRGTDTIGNMRTEMVKDSKVFKDLHLTKANGEDAGNLASHHIQVIAGREQLDSRKYGTRMKQDLTSTLMDMRSLDKLGDFFAQLKKDAKSTDEIKKNSAEFFSSILELSQEGKVYISDDVEKVNKFFEGKGKKQLSSYLAYLDQLRDLFGGNEGLGRVYSLDDEGNLVRTKNARTFYTNLGGDDNVQYGDLSSRGAVDFRTGHDSMTRVLRMAVSQMTEDEKKAYMSGSKDMYDVAEDISSQFDAAKKDKEELERLKQSNKESVANMRKTVTKGIVVKDLNKGLDEQKYITVGKGKGYDVDIDAVEVEERDQDTKEILNKEKTLTAMIDKKRGEVAEARKKAKIKAMEAELSEIKDKEEKEKKRAEIEAFKKAKADESELQVVIDTQGVQFGKKVTYGDKTYGYQGKAIYLDRDNGSLKGYQERGYAGELNIGLVNALQSGEVSKIAEAAENVVEKAINSVNYKEGSDYQRLLKKKMPHSISGHTSAVNMASIMTQEEYDEEKKKQEKLKKSGNADYRKLLVSDINSFGVQLSKDVVEDYLKAKKPDGSGKDEYSTKELRKMLFGFGLDKKEDVEKMGRKKIIDLILKTLTVDMDDGSRWSKAYKSGNLKNGLSVVSGRFPFMNGLDLDALTKVFIGKDVDGNQIKVGAGLAKKENADYDGDHENLKFMKLSGGESALFGKAAEMRENALRKLGWIAKREGENDDAEMQVFSDDYYRGVSSDLVKQSALLAGRRNKGATGVFSNFATQIRNTMRDIGFDETGMGHGTKEETENAATAIIVRSYFEAMEQDMISAKKVIKRIVKETGVKAEDVTKETVEEYQKRMLESVDGIIQQFYDGTIDFKDLNKQLAEMKILDEENGKVSMNNRVTQSGLLAIEELKGGKEFLKKLYGGKYREYAMYGKATDEDVSYAQSFEGKGKGGFGAWFKTAKAKELFQKLDSAGAKYDKKDLYAMLLSGKIHEEDFGTVNEEVFMKSMDKIAQYAQAHGEYGIDGTADSFLRTAKNKTHSPDKRNVETNPYHADNTPFTEAEKAAADRKDKNNANISNNAAAISNSSAGLAGASGDISRALSNILEYIKDFSNGLMSDAAGAKFMAEAKNFKSPFSTTSVTSTVFPYEGLSGDPAIVDKILNHKNERYLGYSSVEELRRNLGSGDAAGAALRGHVVGERTQFMQSLKEIAKDKGWKGSEDDLLKEFEKNFKALEAETDSSVKQTVSFYEAFHDDEKKYLEFLEAIHGENGYVDKDFFLGKQKYGSYQDILKHAYLSQSKSLETFFSPDKMVELNGEKVKTVNEDAFVGAADASGKTNFIGRTDISGLVNQAVKNQDGSESTKKVLALVDQKTKLGKKLSPADILQGIMNAFAANEDIKMAKSFKNKDGSYDFESWIKSDPVRILKERTEQAGVHLDWNKKFENLVNADGAQSFIQKTNPRSGETSFVSIDSLFPSLQSKVIMAQVAKAMKGDVVASQELTKLINSRMSSLADAGLNIGGVDEEPKYAGATEEEVAQSYLNLSKKKLELEEKKKELQYQIKDDTVEKNDTDIKVLKDKLKQVNEDLKQTEKDIKEAVDTHAKLDKFKKEVVDKNNPGAAGTTKEIDVAKELEGEKKGQKLKYQQFAEEAQKESTAKLSSTLERMVQLRRGMREREVRSSTAGTQGISKEQQLVNRLANEKDQKEYEELANSLRGVDWKTSVGGAETLSKVLGDASRSANLADQQVAALNSDLNPTIWTQMANSVKGWFTQLMRGQLVWKILGQVQRAIGTVIEGAKKLDAVLVNLQIVTGDTRENTRNLISTYASLAQTLSSTTSEVASAANDWLRQGYSISESIDLITASLQLSKLGMIDSGRATSYLTSMLKGFKLEASDATTVVDKLTKVDMSAATSAGDIAEALRQFATTAQLSGVDLDESIAMATTIMDVSQKDASSTGNAIKTMLSRYGNVKAGTYSGMNITGDQNETTESLNDIDKVLKKLGISLRSSNLEFRDFDDVLDDIASKWETLDSVSKNAIATAMAGTRQRESFLVLMENYDKYKDFIEEAANSEGTAAEKYKAYEDSLEASQKKLAAAWEELASKTEVVDFFKQINNVMAAMVKHLPLIARTFIRMFSGKAAANALNILQRSGSFNGLSMKGLKGMLKSSFDPTYGLFGGKTGRTGLIDSQIRKGTSPILAELKKITQYMGKSSASKGASGLDQAIKTPTDKSYISASQEDTYSERTEKEILADTSLTDKQKKKAINAIKFDKDILNNKKEIKRLKQKEASLMSGIKGDKLLEVDDGGKKAAELKKIREQRRKLTDENYKLKRKKNEYNMFSSGFERDNYIASHTVEPQLEDGTKLSAIKQNKDGTYSAKGHKGKISKKKYEELKQQQEASRKEAGEEFDRKKKQETKVKTVAAAAAGISGFMSADTHNAHKNKFTGEWETNETTNENAKGVMKANTGIATALGTFFGGEAGGAIAGFVADNVNKYVIGNLIPAVRDENLKNDRFGQADKKKKQVEGAKSSIANVVDLASKETLTADDYSSLVKAQNELKDFMTKSENAGFKDEFVAYANKFLAGQSEGNEYAAKSFDELANLADMTDAQRKKTAYALKVAQTKQANLAENAEHEKELDNLNTDLDNDYLDVSGYNDRAKTTTATLTAAGALTGGAAGGLAGAGVFSWATALLGAAVGGMAGYASAKAANEADREATLASWNDQSRDEQIATLEELKAQGKGDSAKLTAMISKLQNINDTIKKIRDKMDQQRVEEGILEMSVGKNADGSNKTLLDLSQNALKDMGPDAIIEKMASYLQDKFGGMADGSSYFYTDENGNRQVTASARKSILKGLKSNEDIYGAITGQNYRLSDILGMKDGQTKTEMLNNFANALHVSVDELQGLGTAFGNFTLGDLSASADELSSKFSDMQTAITNIASGTQSWATTLQSVAKTYPELLGYASDEYTLSLAMFQKMSDYKKLQTDAQMADIMSNETYFDTFSDKLKESLSGKEWEDFRNAQINSFNDLQQYVANNDTDLSKKLNEAAQAELKNIKLMSNEERQVLEKVVSIKNAQIDKEISNLISQKEAMQNINSQREYENKLIEAKLRLENASKEKKRVWREGVGWVYEEDQAAISEAKDNLDSVTNEKSVSAVTKQINQLNADKDYLSSILSNQEEATQKAFLQAYSDANGVTSDNITSLGSSLEETLKSNSEQANEKWDEWMDEYRKKEDNSKDTLKERYDALQKAKEAMGDPNLSDEERAKAQESYNTALSNYQATYNEGLSKGYWKASDFAEGGSMYEKFGGQNDATAAGAGGAGYKQAQPDQFLYQKDDSGNWNKFVYNPGKTDVLSSSEWNKFYDKDSKASADFYNASFGDGGSNHKLKVDEDTKDVTAHSIYEAASQNTTSTGFASWLESHVYGPSLVRIGQSGKWARFIGGLAYDLGEPKQVSENEVPEAVRKAGGSFKKGSTDISRGNRLPLLMNEEGSEAIVTPNGTITALPAHSGIIPADVTSNLWNLGNYAPDLLRALQRQTLLGMGISGTAADNSVDNSVSINTVQMTVDADSGFNVDSFVQQLRQVAALTRNNRH